MPRHVALLRGINVGGHRVKMDRLRELFEELGFEEVATFIASGNVIFSASPSDVAELEDEIERHLAERLGYEVPTFIRSPEELESVAAFEPAALREGEPSALSLYVIFLPASADDDLRAGFAALTSEMDTFTFSGREIYWLIKGKLTDSPSFGPRLERATRNVPTTMRNMTSVRKLVTKLGATSQWSARRRFARTRAVGRWRRFTRCRRSSVVVAKPTSGMPLPRAAGEPQSGTARRPSDPPARGSSSA